MELTELQDEFIRTEQEIDRLQLEDKKLDESLQQELKKKEAREQSILQKNVKKNEKKTLKFLIEVGQNFSILLYSMAKEEQHKILNYCYEYAPEQVEQLYELFRL